MSGSSDQDQDLLARLNALKPTTIDLEQTQASPTMPTTDDGDDIARRFLRLRSRPDQSSQAETVQTEDDHLNEVEDIDEMLKEFRTTEKASLAPGDDKRVQILLAQAQNAFMNDDDVKEDRDDSAQNARADDSTVREQPGHDQSETDQGDEAHSSEDEDAEADELLAQILAEVRLNVERAEAEAEPEPEKPSREDAETHDESHAEPVDEAIFPTTPSKNPEPSTPADATFQLPSAPTTAPTKPKPKSPLKKYTDEEIETWCEICQANAQVKCLGCDGELYCIRCWKEGHTGPDAGYEERQHRCIQYSKPGAQPAAA